MACRRPGDKPLSEPMMVWLLMHTCFTQLQWSQNQNQYCQHQFDSDPELAFITGLHSSLLTQDYINPQMWRIYQNKSPSNCILCAPRPHWYISPNFCRQGYLHIECCLKTLQTDTSFYIQASSWWNYVTLFIVVKNIKSFLSCKHYLFSTSNVLCLHDAHFVWCISYW